MKKIFTLVFCALAAITASAQIEIVKDGKVVKDGETIEFHATALELAPGFTIIECAPNEPALVNKGASAANVTVRVEKENEKDAFSWCILGSCKPMTGASMSQSFSLQPGAKENLQLHAEGFNFGEYKTNVAHVSVTSNGQTQKITIKYIYSETAGIENARVDQISIANNQLYYNFANNAVHQLNIYGVSGRMVKSENLSQNGSIALNELHRGVYIYEITTNGKRTAAHKFVLK